MSDDDSNGGNWFSENIEVILDVLGAVFGFGVIVIYITVANIESDPLTTLIVITVVIFLAIVFFALRIIQGDVTKGEWFLFILIAVLAVIFYILSFVILLRALP